MKRISLILSFVLFILLCVTTSFWVLQFIKPQTRKISAPPMVRPVADVQSVAGLFGGALAVNTNYQLKGIVLSNPGSQSEAIVVVDGRPAAAFTVGTEINPGVKLSEVHAGYILILDNGVSKRVDLPLPQDAKSAYLPGSADSVPSGSPAPSASNAGAAMNDNVIADRNVRGHGPRTAQNGNLAGPPNGVFRPSGARPASPNHPDPVPNP